MTALDTDPGGDHGVGAGRVGHRVTVLADDLTGAGDAVVQFRLEGWSAMLQLGAAPMDEADSNWAADDDRAVAVSRTLDTRALSHADAFATTRDAVQRLDGDDTSRLYVKIDSTMRGSVAAQVEGALSGWRCHHPGAFAIVCPAYPAMGRVVIDGVVHVNGQLLEDSPAGTDPVTPVSTSVLTDLLPGSTRAPAPNDSSLFAKQLAHAADTGSGVVVVDAADESALESIATVVAGLGARCVAVGSAGLSRHLARSWAGAPRFLGAATAPGQDFHRWVVGVSSRNTVSEEQLLHLARAEAGRIAVVELNGEDLANEGSRARPKADAVAMSGAEIIVVTLSPPARRATDGVAVEMDVPAEAAAEVLGDVVSGLVSGHDVGALLLVGGDGARATLQALGATGVVIDGQAAEGVPVGRLVGGTAAGTVIATKAGGFGGHSTLTDVIHHIEKTLEGLR